MDHGVDHTAGQVAAQLTVLAFGHDARRSRPTPARSSSPPRTAAGIGGGGGGLAAAADGRRQPGGDVGHRPVAAVWSGTRIVGEVFPYLLLWTCPLLLPGTIGGGALLLPGRRIGPGRGGRLARPSSSGSASPWPWRRNRFCRYPSARWRQRQDSLSPGWPTVGYGGSDPDRRPRPWPLATGVAVRLEKEGFIPTVDQEWTFAVRRSLPPHWPRTGCGVDRRRRAPPAYRNVLHTAGCRGRGIGVGQFLRLRNALTSTFPENATAHKPPSRWSSLVAFSRTH